MPLCYKHFLVHPYQVNTFVVYDSDTLEAFLIDPACWVSKERRLVTEYISVHHLKPVGIVNTHMHLDHNASNVYFKKLYSIPVYAHEGDQFMLDDRDFLRARADRIPAEGLGEIDVFLKHDQLLPLGRSELRVIHTPGHSPGSLCLHAENDGFLFSGDTLFHESIGRSDLPRGNHSQLLRSIVQRLFCLNDQTVVLPGHDDFTTIGHERMYSPFF